MLNEGVSVLLKSLQKQQHTLQTSLADPSSSSILEITSVDVATSKPWLGP